MFLGGCWHRASKNPVETEYICTYKLLTNAGGIGSCPWGSLHAAPFLSFLHFPLPLCLENLSYYYWFLMKPVCLPYLTAELLLALALLLFLADLMVAFAFPCMRRQEETRAPVGRIQPTPQQAFFSFRKNTEEREWRDLWKSWEQKPAQS